MRVYELSWIFQYILKTSVSLLRTCAYQGVRNIRFLENLACFIFLKHGFEFRPFALLPTICELALAYNSLPWFNLITDFRNLFQTFMHRILKKMSHMQQCWLGEFLIRFSMSMALVNWLVVAFMFFPLYELIQRMF